MTEMLYFIVFDAFWAAIAALGFAILFNVPPRALVVVAVGGAIGHVVRSALMTYVDFPIAFATLLGATSIGFIGRYAAQRWRMPSMIFTVSASIPLVPGVLAYRAMLGLLQISSLDYRVDTRILTETAAFGINTALTLGAIAVGIIAPKLLFSRNIPIV